MTDDTECPRCKQAEPVEGKIRSTFLLPHWGLLHYFSPRRKSGMREFRMSKKMKYCRACGLLWQETESE